MGNGDRGLRRRLEIGVTVDSGSKANRLVHLHVEVDRNGIGRKVGGTGRLCQNFLAQAAKYGYSSADVIDVFEKLNEGRLSS